MTVEWTTTSQSAVAAGVKALIYGNSGVGKTMLCATAPRPLILSAESGLLSLTKRNIEKVFGANVPHISYDLTVAKVKTIDDLTAIYNFLIGPQALDKSGQRIFSSVCIDSLTEIGEVVLSNAKKTSKDPRQAYGELIDRMELIIRAYRDLPAYHVFMFAKAAQAKDDVSGAMLYSASMPGSKLGPMLPYYFDEVLRLGINKTNEGLSYRFLQTESDLQYVAKDRSGHLAAIEKPDLTYIIQKITGV